MDLFEVIIFSFVCLVFALLGYASGHVEGQEKGWHAREEIAVRYGYLYSKSGKWYKLIEEEED